MNHSETDTQELTLATLIRVIVLAIMSSLLIAAILFLSSWEWDWVMAWFLVGIQIMVFIINSQLVDKELIDERSKFKENTKSWDRILLPILRINVGLVLLLIAGLDKRLGWTTPPLSLPIQLVGMGLHVLGQAVLSWSMASNRFFSDAVRIQTDRGHTVESRGPYRYVRHPGYVGGILYALGVPLMLGSLWAFIPGGLGILIIVTRTVLEDKTLQEELAGYKEYTQQTRFRLLPGIW